MNLRVLRAIAVILVLVCGVDRPASAAGATDADALKADIEGFLDRVLSSGNGVLAWDGADNFDVKSAGDEAIAVITNGRVLVHKAADPKTRLATITLDHLEIHRKPAPQGGDFVEYDILLPQRWNVVATDGSGEGTLSLDGAKMTAIVQGEQQHQRAMTLTAAGGHIEVKDSASKASFGPITGNWKLDANADGSWHTPADLELKSIEVDAAEAPLVATVDRIAYSGGANGSNVAALDAFRDEATAAREEIQRDPDRAAAQYLGLLAKMLTAFSASSGEATIEGVIAKRPGGETLVTLKKASFGGSLDGLGGDAVKFRFALSHDDLTIAASLLPAAQVPAHAKLEFGVEDISGSVLHTIAEAGANVPANATDSDRQQATAQMMAAALTLKPVFRVYDATVDFKDVSINATAEAKRAAPLPFGFSADADVKIRNFDGLSDILTVPELRDRLPLLQFIGDPDTGSNGASVLKYHLAAGLTQPLTVNGNDLSAWNGGTAAKGSSDQPRILRPADPPLTGDDVRAVQKTLGTSRIKPFTDGVYDTATALAVMRFQKEHKININGVVDASTRDKLGLTPAAPGPKSPAPGSKN